MKSFLRRSKRHGEQDFELNLASVIDCLTVLITFVLISASFASIGILDASVAAGGEQLTARPDGIDVTVDLKRDHSIFVTVSGPIQRAHRILPPRSRPAEWDFDALSDRLALIKGQWPRMAAITLSADDSVDYRDVVRTMEITRLAVPTVNLGGF